MILIKKYTMFHELPKYDLETQSEHMLVEKMVLIHSLTLVVTTLQFVKDATSAKCNKRNMEYLQGFFFFFANTLYQVEKMTLHS